MIEPHRAAYFARKFPQKPKIRETPEIEISCAIERIEPLRSEPVVRLSAAEKLDARILAASAPTPLPPPEATEVWRAPGTRRVVPGPHPCRRWGGR